MDCDVTSRVNFALAKVPWYYDERWHQRAMSAQMLLGQLGLHTVRWIACHCRQAKSAPESKSAPHHGMRA